MEVIYSGSGALTDSFYNYSINDTTKNLIFINLLLVITCWLLFRWKWGVVFSFIIVGISNLAVVIAAYLFSYKLNNLTVCLPALILAIGIADTFHFISTYLQNLEESPNEVLKRTIKKVFIPCFFTSATTIVGFLSLYVSRLAPLRQFGVLASVGILTAFLATFSLLPVLLSLVKPPKEFKIVKIFNKTIINRYVNSLKNPVFVIMVSLAAIVSCFMLTDIESEASYLEYFSPELKIY